MASKAAPFLISALVLCQACFKSPALVGRGDGGVDARMPLGSSDGRGLDDGDGPGFTFTVSDGGDAPPAPAGWLDCAAAAAQRGNAGCSFFAMPIYAPNYDGCFAMFVVNAGPDPVKLQLGHAGEAVSMAQVARLPRGAGRSLSYAPFDEAAGLPPNGVAILFLSMGPDGDRCPNGVQPAVTETAETPIKQAFHLVSDRPVIAYQMLPYGGAGSAATSSTLLLPEEAWGTTYLAPIPKVRRPFIVAIAAQDGTEVTFRPPPPGAPVTASLAAGGVVTFPDRSTAAVAPLGTAVIANKPVAVMGAMMGGYLPDDPMVGLCCSDSSHQQIPPLSAWGHEYAAVRHRSRALPNEELGLWQLVGVVDGTVLSYEPARPAGAPATLAAGQVVELLTKDPFVVRSQDARHPFYLGSFMTSSSFPFPPPGTGNRSMGDPEFVNVVPTAQYAPAYTFFTDPTYPETNLVVVRKRGPDGQFADVQLECASEALSGWNPLGDYQYTRVDLVTGNFKPVIPGCDNGRQRMTSAAPFAVTVWGWGSGWVMVGQDSTADVSYGYPAGGGLRPVNDVVIR